MYVSNFWGIQIGIWIIINNKITFWLFNEDIVFWFVLLSSANFDDTETASDLKEKRRLWKLDGDFWRLIWPVRICNFLEIPSYQGAKIQTKIIPVSEQELFFNRLIGTCGV